MRKPTVKRGVADGYAMQGETIVEFTDGKSGGLISIWRHPDGKLMVQVYHCDDDVEVTSAGAAQQQVRI